METVPEVWSNCVDFVWFTNTTSCLPQIINTLSFVFTSVFYAATSLSDVENEIPLLHSSKVGFGFFVAFVHL